MVERLGVFKSCCIVRICTSTIFDDIYTWDIVRWGAFNSIVNVVFHNIVSIVKKHSINEINVDLTYGTNIVAQALMLSVSTVKVSFENININLW